jgi:hypothetical protein
MPRKIASGNSCNNLSMIQRSDQELGTSWAGTLVWPDQTPPGSNDDFFATPSKQPSWNSYKNLRMIQWSDQELLVGSRVMNLLSSTFMLSLVWLDQTLAVSSINNSATPRKTASRNSSKNSSTIQWSDQELWTSWAGTLVWPDQTPPGSNGNFIATPSKKAYWNSCKN